MSPGVMVLVVMFVVFTIIVVMAICCPGKVKKEKKKDIPNKDKYINELNSALTITEDEIERISKWDLYGMVNTHKEKIHTLEREHKKETRQIILQLRDKNNEVPNLKKEIMSLEAQNEILTRTPLLLDKEIQLGITSSIKVFGKMIRLMKKEQKHLYQIKNIRDES